MRVHRRTKNNRRLEWERHTKRVSESTIKNLQCKHCLDKQQQHASTDLHPRDLLHVLFSKDKQQRFAPLQRHPPLSGSARHLESSTCAHTSALPASPGRPRRPLPPRTRQSALLNMSTLYPLIYPSAVYLQTASTPTQIAFPCSLSFTSSYQNSLLYHSLTARKIATIHFAAPTQHKRTNSTSLLHHRFTLLSHSPSRGIPRSPLTSKSRAHLGPVFTRLAQATLAR